MESFSFNLQFVVLLKRLTLLCASLYRLGHFIHWQMDLNGTYSGFIAPLSTWTTQSNYILWTQNKILVNLHFILFYVQYFNFFVSLPTICWCCCMGGIWYDRYFQLLFCSGERIFFQIHGVDKINQKWSLSTPWISLLLQRLNLFKTGLLKYELCHRFYRFSKCFLSLMFSHISSKMRIFSIYWCPKINSWRYLYLFSPGQPATCKHFFAHWWDIFICTVRLFRTAFLKETVFFVKLEVTIFHIFSIFEKLLNLLGCRYFINHSCCHLW